MSNESIREKVREEYAQAARRVSNPSGSCCGSAAPAENPITLIFIRQGDIPSVPAGGARRMPDAGNPNRAGRVEAGRNRVSTWARGGRHPRAALRR